MLNSPTGNPRSNYLQGDDGNWYNANGERVYYWVPSAETDSTINGDSETQGIGQNLGGYYTESEIKSAWDADEGMGYLKEQTDWDNYWGFLSERQGEIQAGSLVDPIQGNFAGQAKADGVANTDANYQANSGRDEEVYYAQVGANTQLSQQDQMAGWVDQNADLMGKYGIESEITNDNGDTFKFNGSTYSRTNKIDDHGHYGELAGAALVGGFLSAGIAPALSGFTAVPKSAITGAVSSAGTQGLMTGSIDPSQVLKDAAMAAGGAVIGDYAKDSLTGVQKGSDLGGLLGESGMLSKLGVPGTDQLLSTKAGSTFFDWYANNPITSAVETALQPVLRSQYGQYALDKLTSGMMGGYDDEWKSKRDFNTEEQSWEWDGTETAEDIKNYARFNNAISGDGIIQSFVENGGNKTGMWELDEQYFYTEAERDKDSIVSGILTKPIEEGGSPTVPVVATPEGKGNEQGGSGGEKGDKKSNSSESNSNDKGLDADGDDAQGSQASAGGTAGWFDSNGNWVGTDEGKAFLSENGLVNPNANDDAKLSRQMIEAIYKADSDPDTGMSPEEQEKFKQDLIGEYNNLFITSPDLEVPPATTGVAVTGGGSDQVITEGSDEVVLPGDDTVVLPPTSGGVTGLPLDAPISRNGGAIPEWTDLYGYTKISPYKKARLKVLAGMLSGIPGVSMDSLALSLDSGGDPYRKIGMSDWDSGLERNT